MSARLEEREALDAGRDCVSVNSGIETKRGAAGREPNFSLRESDRKRGCVSVNSGIETKRGAAGREPNFSLRESDRKRGRATPHQTEKGAHRRSLDMQETAEGDMKVDT